jgi:hypothetical protein
MAHVLKTGETAVARQFAASALNRRSLLKSGMAAAGAFSAGAAPGAAQDAAKTAESTLGRPRGMQMLCLLMALGPMARAGAKLSWASTPKG